MNTKRIIKAGLGTIASVVGVAGAVTLLPEAVVPAVAVAAAKQVLAWGTLAGVVAAGVGFKGLNSLHTPPADKRGQIPDAEEPKP
jgi:hypothetical protein